MNFNLKNINMKKTILIPFMIILVGNFTFSQSSEKKLMNQQLTEQSNSVVLGYSDSIKASKIPELKIPKNYNLNKSSLPAIVDNSTQPYHRPPYNQVALECGQASGIGMGFTYEINYKRNTPANISSNQYATHFTWNFENNGTSQGVSFFDTWNIVKEFGNPNVDDYGGTMWYGGTGRWMSGYNEYYNAMHNRIKEIYSIPVDTEEGLNILKAWLYNHIDGSSVGGVANYYGNVPTLYTLDAGTPEAGKKVVIAYGYASHGMTIVGYNDSIRYDYNGDGLYTNDIDINNDGKIDMNDWEIGALKMVNTYGGVPNWGDGGFAYMMYRTLAAPYGSGGIWSNKVYVLYTMENYEPLLTMRLVLKHDSRDKIKVTAGISLDTTSNFPQFIREFPIFNYQGGNLYMQGGTSEIHKTIEFGLDLSPLLNLIDSNQIAKYFLLINEDDPSNIGTGNIISYSLIDYTNSANETFCINNNVPIVENGNTILSIVTAVNHSKVEIENDTLSKGTVNEQYEYQLLASGGTPPYSWSFNYNYLEEDSTALFPNVSAQAIATPNNNNSYISHQLDFSFPFYGEFFDEIFIHTDGYIMFDEMPSTWPYQMNSDLFFSSHSSITPFQADLRFYSSNGDGIWYEGDQNSATIRYKASINGNSSGTDLNFAIKLFPNGDIEFYYGNMTYPSMQEWFSGIFKGNNVDFQYSNISSEQSIQNNRYIKFNASTFPEELSISEDGYLRGLILQEYLPTNLNFKVTDASSMVSSKFLEFSTDGINSLLINGFSVISGTDSIIEFGETTSLSIDIINIANQADLNAYMTLTSDDPYISFIDSTEYIGFIDTGIITSISNGFSFNVSNDIPNSHNIVLNTQILAVSDTSESHIELFAYAPILEIENVEIIDGNNNSLDPGETADLILTIKNIGGAKIYNTLISISSNDPYITINSNSGTIPLIEANSSETISFNVTASLLTPFGYNAEFSANYSADNQYSANDIFWLGIGFISEDFETGDFSSYSWIWGGPTHWEIDSTNQYEGTFCSKSGIITHNEETFLAIELNALANGEISFFKKVSCEADVNNHNYDYLAFFIDGVEQGRWDGEISWSQEIFPVSAGNHTYKWTYHKDYSVNSGYDCSWIDYITFPPTNQFVVNLPAIADNKKVLSNFPNPFSEKTNIVFEIDAKSTINLDIYNVGGQKIVNLIFNENYSKGKYSVVWDGRDMSGNLQTSGIYYYKIYINNYIYYQKMILLK